MKFSVLLSVYKNEKPEYLRIALQSIVEQTLMPSEIVIVEDGHLTNGLREVIDEFKGRYAAFVKVMSFNENRGLGLALRDGVLACSNEYIARMDTDDIALSERFEVQIAYMREHPEIAMLGSWVAEFSDDPDQTETITKLPCKYEDILAYAKRRNPFRHMTIIFKKSAVIDSGNYKEFLWFEDYDLWIRIMKKGYLVENLPQVLVNVRADDEMFARRGGWKYFQQDFKFQKFLRKSNFITDVQFAENVLLRGFVRIMPNNLRLIFYKKLLRK